MPCSRSASGRASSRASGANPALESSTIQSNTQVIQYLAEVSWCRVRRDIAVGPQHGDLTASGGEPAAQLAVGILDQVQARARVAAARLARTRFDDLHHPGTEPPDEFPSRCVQSSQRVTAEADDSEPVSQRLVEPHPPSAAVLHHRLDEHNARARTGEEAVAVARARL